MDPQQNSAGELPVLSFAAEPPEGSLAVPLPRIIEEAAGFLYYGGPRSGKSHAVRQFLEETHGRIQHIVFDSEGEFYTLREAFPYLLAATGGEGDIPLSVATAGVLCARVMELGVSLICDLSGLSIEERPAYVAAFLTQLLETPKELWHPVVVVVDEVHRFAPQDGATVSKSLLANLPAIGRKRGFIAFYATQNIEQVDKGVIAYLPNKLVGKITMDNRRKRAADDFGLSNADRERLKSMKRGQFFGQGIFGDGDTVLLQVPDTMTHAAQVGTSGWKTAPPVPDAIKELLAHFAALPDEADEEVKNLEDAKTRIAELEKQLAGKSEGATATTKVVYVDKPVRVEVPVISEEALQRAEAIQRSLAENAAQLRDEGQERLAMAKDAMNSANELGTLLAQQRKSAETALPTPATIPAPTSVPEPMNTVANTVAKPSEPASRPKRPAPVAPKPRPVLSPGLAAPQQKVLNALAAFTTLGRTETQRSLVAKWAGYSPKSSGFRNLLSELRGKEMVVYVDSDRVALTDAGRAAANDGLPPLDSLDALHSAWYDRLTNPQRTLLEVLVAVYPQAIDRSDLAARTGNSPASSGFRNYLSELRTLGVADYPDGKSAKATRLVFPDHLVGKG